MKKYPLVKRDQAGVLRLTPPQTNEPKSELFKHPVWQNRYSRYAIICLAIAALPVNIVHGVLELVAPAYMPVTASIGITLGIVGFVLMWLAYRSFKPEQDNHILHELLDQHLRDINRQS